MNRSSDAPQVQLSPVPVIEECIGDEFRPLVDNLVELADSRGWRVYLVGGPVRDWLLGVAFKDLDFVVEGNALELARALAVRIGAQVVAHQRFGTASLSLGELRVDLVTARRETYSVPGALPVVEPSSILDDLARRDFSVNAMALPLNGKECKLLDPHGGRDDLAMGVIRTLHAGSFVDDPTRLFRAVRYGQRLGYVFEENTGGEFLAAVRAKAVETVSGDRLRHEIERMFEERLPARALSGAMERGILPCLPYSEGRVELLTRWQENGAAESNSPNAGPLGWVAALGYPMSAVEGENAIRRLNMPAAWSRVLRDAISIRENSALLDSPEEPPSEICGLLEGKSVEAVLVSAALTQGSVMGSNLLRYARDWKNIKPSLSGDDLISMGVPAGPAVGETLARLRQARLDRVLSSEEEERRWVAELVAAEFASALTEDTGAPR